MTPGPPRWRSYALLQPPVRSTLPPNENTSLVGFGDKTATAEALDEETPPSEASINGSLTVLLSVG